MSNNGILNGSQPAFPQPIDDMGTLRSVTAGMSLRHWTATQSLSVAMDLLKLAATKQPINFSPETLTDCALAIADSLIAKGNILGAK